jgi:SAM-dependent methyltransferase
MTYATMSDYYASQSLLPTHGRFTTAPDLVRHTDARERFFNDKLFLPKRLFYHADVMEIGCDSGENALAFATWRAYLTLVEPNAKAHPVIREYFQRYRLESQISKLTGDDVAQLAAAHQEPVYDFVIAEGFIYTVQPSSLWLDLFARLLRPGGFAVVSYYEKHGGWVELFTKRIYNRVKDLTGLPGIEVAHKLFDVKWAMIPHMRSFDQWVMDVLQDPFVDSKFFLEAEELCQQAEAAGLRLYSSWPQYRPPWGYWHKNQEPAGSRARWIEQQRPTWQFGDAWGRYCLSRLQGLLDAGDAEAIIRFSRSDKTWLSLWGLPNHFACLQKI